jgi:hypothetical protein
MVSLIFESWMSYMMCIGVFQDSNQVIFDHQVSNSNCLFIPLKIWWIFGDSLKYIGWRTPLVGGIFISSYPTFLYHLSIPYYIFHNLILTNMFFPIDCCCCKHLHWLPVTYHWFAYEAHIPKKTFHVENVFYAFDMLQHLLEYYSSNSKLTNQRNTIS